MAKLKDSQVVPSEGSAGPVVHRPCPRFLYARDGTRIAFYEGGPRTGRPVVLVHGHTLTAASNWIDPGLMGAMAALGRRVVAVDLRAHGSSDAPHDISAYRKGVLAEDLIDLVRHLRLRTGTYDLVGYSIGSRVVATAVTMADGLRPRRVVLGGMGLEGLVQAEGRGWPIRRALAYPYTDFPDGSFEAEVLADLPDDADRTAQGLIPETNVNIPLRSLIRVHTPTLVVMGASDNECADAFKLSQILPHGRYAEVPGIHIRAFRGDDFRRAVTAFLEQDQG